MGKVKIADNFAMEKLLLLAPGFSWRDSQNTERDDKFIEFAHLLKT